MRTRYEIVRYRPEHKGRVAALQAHLWSRDAARTTRYLEWKYEQNPYAKEPDIYLALAGDAAVGMRGFYGARWESGQAASRRQWSVPVADDFVIAPEHRNHGLATLIMRTALEDLTRRGHGYLFNLSGSQVTVLGSLAMGWKSAGPLEPIGWAGSSPTWRVRAVLHRTPLLWRLAESRLLRTVGEREPFRLLDRAASRRRAGSVAIEREPRADAMSELVERLGHDGRIRHVRDREFFAWRFRNPLRLYRYLYSGGERLDGYLVLRAPDPASGEPRRVAIVDLETASASVRAELLEAAMGAGEFRELFTWAAGLPPDARAWLASHGFEPVDRHLRAHGCPCILTKQLATQVANGPWRLGDNRLTDLAAWDLRMIYTMAG